MTHEQPKTLSLSNLTASNWMVIICGCLFIGSLFLNWASTGGFLFLISKGIAFMKIKTSKASGLPVLNLLTLLAVVGCILLCLPFLRKQDPVNRKVISIIQVILSVLGLLPFILLPFELRSWLPYGGRMEIGGWLAVVAVFGLLIGAILTMAQGIGSRQKHPDPTTPSAKNSKDDFQAGRDLFVKGLCPECGEKIEVGYSKCFSCDFEFLEGGFPDEIS